MAEASAALAGRLKEAPFAPEGGHGEALFSEFAADAGALSAAAGLEEQIGRAHV